MIYRLEGHLSYIDKYNHLKFAPAEGAEGIETQRKLTQMMITLGVEESARRPFNREGFTVSMPKSLHITDDLRALIGFECVIHVRPSRYSFTSKLARNKGEKVSGVSLVLDDIHKSDRYE
jgi:hypothetical protein